MHIERNINLKSYNTFGLPTIARQLIRIRSEEDIRKLIDNKELGLAPKLILGGGSNVILTREIESCVLKIEIQGRRLLEETPNAWIIEVGAGEIWHDIVKWTLSQGWPGLENLALIPGTVGAAPVQNIGAYGVELQDRFESLDIIDFVTGRTTRLSAAACRFEYRNSVFKKDLFGKCIITKVRLRLPKPWHPILNYLDIEKKIQATQIKEPTPEQIFEWICTIRKNKLPDPLKIGNVGSFFKNPIVTMDQGLDIISREPEIAHYPLEDGTMKLAAGWLIEACGWKGKSIGQAGVYEKQALILINKGEAIGAEVLVLARAIQESVYGRFGIRLELEPLLI